MVSTAPKSKWSGHKQRRMGPAPFASFEDLSDDLDSPEEKQCVTRLLPGIREDVCVSLQTPSTPRIDISRASSSSHHDSNNSRDSSPERELFAGCGEVPGAKLGLGFKEEGTADLRSSTEELDFHEEPGTVEEQEAKKRRERRAARQQQQQQHTLVFKYELEAQSEKERKDSACSDVGLLSISGRTSRLSSVGSGGSGTSHISGMSHLSVMSGHSAASSGRSPSPHKMLLETSFCGSKPIALNSIDLESPPNKHETESLEKALLSRKIDPTVAIVGDVKSEQVHKSQPITSQERLDDGKTKKSKAEATEEHVVRNKTEQEIKTNPIVEEKAPPQTHELPRDALYRSEYRNEWQLRDRDEWGPHTRKPVSLNLSDSGKKPVTFTQLVQQQELQQVESQEKQSQHPQLQHVQHSSEVSPSMSPKLSRQKKTNGEGSYTPSPTHTSRKSSFTSIFKRNEDMVLSPESPTVVSTKRKSSGLTTILKEASDVIRDRSRSRSKSRERVATTPGDTKGKKDNKNKSVFSSLFKKRDKKKGTRTPEDDILSPVELAGYEQKLEPIGNVEFTFNTDGHHTMEQAASCIKERVAQAVESSDMEQEREGMNHVNSVLSDNGNECKTQTLLPSESVMLPALSQETVMPMLESLDSTSVTDHQSSESERDSEIDYLKTKKQEIEHGEEEPERKGLVVQQDSFDDELPYVPTTLPQERSVAVPIVPIKQRIAEVKTCPIERPRSTTPINPSLLEDYVHTEESREHAIEKMRICLPREDSVTSRSKSPRRVTKTWVEFAEQGLQSPREYRKPSLTEKNTKSPSPPPLPPRTYSSSQTPPPKPTGWINFEEIPEKRKPPKRIQTIPSHGTLDIPAPSENTVYNYVNPEECKCECHENATVKQQPPPTPECSNISTADSVVDRHSYVSDSSYEYPSPYSVGDTDGLKPMKPFGMDLDVTSNRSSIISQDEAELGSPNDNES